MLMTATGGGGSEKGAPKTTNVRQCIGELFKRTSRLGFVSWKGPYHFEMSGTILSYYKQPGLLRPNGMVMITSDSKVEISVCKGRSNCFRVITPTGNWMLQAGTRKERESWMQALGNAMALSKTQETPICAGELDKLAIASHRNWKKRYIELYQNPPQIYYYRKGVPKGGTALPDGIMSLYEGATVTIPSDVPDETLALGKVRRELTFKIFSGHKMSFHAQAPSAAELQRWYAAIKACCSQALPRVHAVANTWIPKRATGNTPRNAHPHVQRSRGAGERCSTVVDSKAGPVKFELPAHYEVISVVGEGAYGVVAQGKSRRYGKKSQIAIKKVSRVFSKGHIMTKRILREIKMLRHLNHRNILGLRDLLNGPSPTSDEVYIVTELMWGDLARLLRRARRDPRRSVLSMDVIRTLSRQLLSALHHMHRANIIHRDLKPQNILIDGGQTPAIKICDFGLARGMADADGKEGDNMTVYVVTRWYRSPELLLRLPYQAAVDMWSAGLIIAELVKLMPIFPGRQWAHQLRLILKVIGAPSTRDMEEMGEEVSDVVGSLVRKGYAGERLEDAIQRPESRYRELPRSFVDLLDHLLQFNPAKRLSAADSLKHPFFKGMKVPRTDDEHVERFKFDEDSLDLTKASLRRTMREEILSFQREQAAKYRTEASAKNGEAESSGIGGK